MTIHDIITGEFEQHVIKEGLARIRTCLNLLDDDELWRKPSDKTNSVGNLIIHLEGNVRQYILSVVAGKSDTRNRASEFDDERREPRNHIIGKLESTVMNAKETIEKLSMEEYSRMEKIQGFEMTVLSCIIHVIEHFSYHVGQITFYTKMLKNVDTGYYAGQDLDKTRD